jgi:hypothetical protein
LVDADEVAAPHETAGPVVVRRADVAGEVEHGGLGGQGEKGEAGGKDKAHG